MKMTRDEHIRAEGAINALDVAEPRIRELEAKVAALEAEVQRLTDLVRYARHLLFDANLISPDEFARLVEDSESGQRVARLEGYDTLRAKVAALEAEREALDDLQGRLWCALGQPVGIEYVQAVRDMKKRNEALEAENGKLRAAVSQDEALRIWADIENSTNAISTPSKLGKAAWDACTRIIAARAQQPSPAQDKRERERFNKGQCAAQVVDCDCVRCSPAQDKEQP